MTPIQPKSISQFGLVKYSINFIAVHFLIIFGAGLIAAFGRAIQLGAVGEISGIANGLLEIIVASVRILTFLLVIGAGSISEGVRRVKSIFHLSRPQWYSIWSVVLARLRVNWIGLIVNLLAYSAIAVIINFVIDKLVFNTDILKILQNYHILAPNTSEWVLLLFLKNISVIPFTIIFNGVILLWITNNLSGNEKSIRKS